MDRMKTLQRISMISLALFICSGVYGIIIGIYCTNEYFQLTDVAITAGTMAFDYFLGSIRGVATVICGILGMASVQKGNVRTGYLVCSGVFVCLYLLGLAEYPDTGEFIQMSIAVFCFAALSVFKVEKCRNEQL